jgi:hypothetical protein
VLGYRWVNECREAGGSASGWEMQGYQQRSGGRGINSVLQRKRREEEKRRDERQEVLERMKLPGVMLIRSTATRGLAGRRELGRDPVSYPYPYQRVVKRIADQQSREKNNRNPKQLHRCALFSQQCAVLSILVAHSTARVHPCRTRGTMSCGR